jgi:hypothetical protein
VTRGDLAALFADLPADGDLPAYPDQPAPGRDREPGSGPSASPVPARTCAGPALPALPAEQAGRRALAASVGVMWAVGVPLVFIVGLPWWLIFVPIAVSVSTARYFGGNRRGPHR